MPPPAATRLISALSPVNRDLLLNSCDPVNLPLRTPLYEPETIPTHGYFMTSGMTSVVSMTRDGQMVEVGIIGAEGVVGGFHLLGPAKVSTRAFLQIEGTALKIPFARLKSLFWKSEEIRTRILEFEQEQSLSLSQVAACNSLHQAEARLARWLLMASDRTQSDDLRVTQEFLGMMLGASRTTVTLTAGTLQRAGLLEYQWGAVRILNRPMLEATACDCYQTTKLLLQNLYTEELPPFTT